jgi:hypothetical protein
MVIEWMQKFIDGRNPIGVAVSTENPLPVTLSGGGPLTNDQLRASPVQVEILGVPGVSRQLAVTTSSASVALTTGCRRISIRARGCNIRYVIGTGAQTASATASHFIGQDERLDLAVPASATIAAIRESAATDNGSLAITELV